MEKLMQYQAFVTVDDAARYLTKRWGEEVTEYDVHRLLNDGHLPTAIDLLPVMSWAPGSNQRLMVVRGPHRLAAAQYTQMGRLQIQLQDGTTGEVAGAEVQHAMERKGILGRDLIKFAEQSPEPQERSMRTRERRTLLTLIAALCKHANIDHQQRGIASALEKITETHGTPITEDTIRSILRNIPDAIESRAK